MFDTVALNVLEQAINQCLQLDPEMAQRLQSIDGRTIAIEITGLASPFFLIINHGEILVQGHLQGQPDTTISGGPASLLRMGVSKDQRDALFEGDVTIRGDVALGQQFKKIFDQLDIDWEEHLSRLVGDVIAHQLCRGGRNIKQWLEQTLSTLGRDVTEYLQEESRLLAVAEQVEAFVSEVDGLRDDVSRLQQRLQRLQRQIPGEEP